MAQSSTHSPVRRRSARLSSFHIQAQSLSKDSDSDFTNPSSVSSPSYQEASSDGLDNSKKKSNGKKRVASDMAQNGTSQPPKRPRRGHSYPFKEVRIKRTQLSPDANLEASLSSRHWQTGKSKVSNSGVDLDTTGSSITQPLATNSKGVSVHVTRSDTKKSPLPSSKLTEACKNSNALKQSSKPSLSSKGKGKARQIELASSEEDTKTPGQRRGNSLRPSTANATSSTKLKPNHEELSDVEGEMVQAAIELSKQDSQVKSRRSEPSRSHKGGPKMNNELAPDPDTDEDSDSLSFSSLSSDSDDDISDSSDDDDESRNQPQVRTTIKRSRTRRTRKPKTKLTWWQKNQIQLEKHHPELIDVWGDLTSKVKVSEPCKANQPDGLDLTLLPFQLEGLDWMKKQEAGPWAGGILADEMGMGKTIQTISLILSDRIAGDGKQTLVIAPTVAIMQWRNEIEKFAKGLTVNVWHGGNRSNVKKEMEKFDVVLTSFSVLESSFRRQHSGFRRKGMLLKESSILHQMKWHRVILDEAHNIKDRSCNTAKGAFELVAKYKWCLSGTPLQNRVGELYSLIRFLGADPFGYYYCKVCDCKSLHWSFSDRRNCDYCNHSPMMHICFWNNEILKPVQMYGASVVGSHGHTAFNKLKVLLDRLMLRRTKLERADDLGLPPRAVVIRRDYFTEEEEELYSSLYSNVTRKFNTFADAGTVLNNYGNIFQLITRMRQMANHPDLVLKSRVGQTAFKTVDALTATNNNPNGPLSIHTCRICLDEAEDAIISRCRHIFCRECIRQYLETATEQEPECPVCHLPITIDLSQDALEDENLGSKARQGVLDRLDPGKWRTSTKIEALVEELNKLNQPDHTIKSIVFSQFTVFLDLIERRLLLAGFKLARLQGNMTPEARDRTIQYFMKNNDVQVFLVSLKAGGVALNLTEASRVFIMDPWWNPAVELQAMDRIHRLGQHRPVIVTRLVIENSIESRIIELQKKKEAMTGAALGDDDQALGRLTPEDLSFLFTL